MAEVKSKYQSKNLTGKGKYIYMVKAKDQWLINKYKG